MPFWNSIAFDERPSYRGIMVTQRVWLSDWEWACCGKPFVAGDQVAFQVNRILEAEVDHFTELLGLELAATIDASESHHEDAGTELIEGTVTAVQGVTAQYVRRAGDYKPSPGSARLCEIPRVPWPPRFGEEVAEPTVSLFTPEFRLVGYLVDVGRNRT